jgi:signal transduction histidine kinase/DNA-binding response OmpR family regulator/HPt (histidine-containing phosphotransfer) domain-containing protein
MVQGVDAEFLRKDGTTLPVSLSAGLLRDAGAHVGIVCVAQDMQERMQLQQTMREAKEAAEAANHAKSDFLARMSHEIRTPMNGVIGMAELLAETELNELQRRFVTNVLRSAESLLGVINDILDFSKIEAGRLELDDAPFDLRELIDETIELFSERSQRSGVELLCGVAPPVRTALRGDPNRLRQVLINLLGNAFKFTEAGEVAVRVTSESEAPDHVQLRFEVRDTGPGIVPEARERIFESFAQADGSITRRYGGTGLGLAICRRLVDLMGGRIGVNSVPGQGATFWFTATFAIEAGVVSDGPAADHVLRGLNVLAVDDNATNRAIVHEQLAAWGIPHETADGYDTALALHRAAAAAGRPFSLGLFDKDMPGRDGLDLARAIRDDLSGVRFPIVILSSLWRELSREEMKALGIRAYLTKPVRQSQLYNALIAITQWEEQPQPKLGTAPVQRGVHFNGRGCRILLVEDNPVNQELGCEMLRSLGCSVAVAEDGAKALDAVRQGAYAAVLMDCQMPVMDGFEATRRLRDAEQARGAARLPVVALTANALQGDRERCLAAGMDDYLSKPFTLAQLAKILGRWVPAGDSVEPVTAQEPPPGDRAEPRLDPQALDAVRALQRPGAPDMVRRIVGLYLESAAKLVPALREAAASGEGPAVRAAAHSLKSASANVGAMRLSVLCKELEGLAREGSLDTAQAKAAAIAAELDAVALVLAATTGLEADTREAAA